MEASAASSVHQHVTLPTLASLMRLLPLCLLFFVTSPNGMAGHMRTLSTRRPSTYYHSKHWPRDPFPSRRGDIALRDLRLSFNTSVLRPALILLPGNSAYATLRPPSTCTRQAPCRALLEAWYDRALPRDQKPDPFLLAANGTVPQPFPPYPVKRLADVEAFHTWRNYHFLPLNNVTAADRWHVRLLNHDSTVFNLLNVTVRVSVVAHGSPRLCPRGPRGLPCTGRGDCRGGVCVCQTGYGGRYCETVVARVPRAPFIVPPDGMRVFRFVAPRASHIATELHLVSPQAMSAAAHPILFAKRLGENGGSLLRTGPPLPTTYDAKFTDAHAVRTRRLTQRVVSRAVRPGEAIYIAVYNFRAAAPAWLVRRHLQLRSSASLPRRTVRVALRVYPCADDAAPPGVLRQCPSRITDWEQSVGVFVGPLLLGTLTLMTMVVCVSVWAGVVRQHVAAAIGLPATPLLAPDAFDTSDDRDKLSEAEVDAMFPAFAFCKADAGALCAVGDASCSICLCAFETADLLRRLPCGHAYHAACIDRWLITNASCPRCRMRARINGTFPPRPRITAWVLSATAALFAASAPVDNARRRRAADSLDSPNANVDASGRLGNLPSV